MGGPPLQNKFNFSFMLSPSPRPERLLYMYASTNNTSTGTLGFGICLRWHKSVEHKICVKLGINENIHVVPDKPSQALKR